MRVTNSMMVNTYRRNLNSNMDRLAGIQAQMSEFEHSKFAHISDDPVSLIYSMQARSKLRQVADYKVNVNAAQSWMTSVETGIMEINTLLVDAYESTIQSSNDPLSSLERQNIGALIGQLRDQMMSALNMTQGDRFIYGGYYTAGYTDADGKTVAPFELKNGTLYYNGYAFTDPAADPDSVLNQDFINDVLTIDVGTSATMPLSFNGSQIAVYGYEEDGTPKTIIGLMDKYYNALMDLDSTAPDLNIFIKDLQDAQEHMLSLAADVGGRSNRLELLKSRYETDNINYTEMMSNAEDADLAELIMKYKMAEATYQAALSIGSYILQPTLMDYLK